MKPLSPGIFRAYDVRGIVNVDFDPDWVEEFGGRAGRISRVAVTGKS
jgi:phosphomannomutase/phosphoglucomutase